MGTNLSDGSSRNGGDSALLATPYARFSLKVFEEMIREQPNTNIVVSPLSLATALALVYNGAQGGTRDAMSNVLELGEVNLEAFNAANAALLASLSEFDDPDIKLDSVNTIEVDNIEALYPDFLQINQRIYGAEIVSSGNPMTISFTNIVHFKGRWSWPFDSTYTRGRPFTLPDGQTKSCPMMAMSDSYWNYYEDSHVQAVRLLYGILGRLSVVVFLPAKETSLSRFLQELTLSNLESWLTRMTRSQGDLVLPRFYTENQIDLVGALTRLGMGVAFQEGQAHFGAMTSLAAHIDRVTQQTWIQVDEEGTEAEAATIVSTVLGMAHAPKEKKFQMVVDRPFFYIIRDDISGMILFMGVTVEPNERP